MYDVDSLLLTCLEDWTENKFIQDDPLGFPQDFRKAIVTYCELLQKDPHHGFGWRHMLDKPQIDVIE